MRIRSEITGEGEAASFGVLHLGDHNVSGGIGRFATDEAYAAVATSLTETFARGDLAAVLRMVDQNFASGTYSLKLLFRDEQRKVLGLILEDTLAEADAAYRHVYEQHAPLMRFLRDHGIPLPRGFQVAAEFALSTALRQALETKEPDLARITTALAEADRVGIVLHEDGLGYAFQRTIERLAERFRLSPDSAAALNDLERLVTLARALPFPVEFWGVQNAFYELLQTAFPPRRVRAEGGDAAALEWIVAFRALGERLSVLVP